jgi:hypothetical protein
MRKNIRAGNRLLSAYLLQLVLLCLLGDAAQMGKYKGLIISALHHLSNYHFKCSIPMILPLLMQLLFFHLLNHAFHTLNKHLPLVQIYTIIKSLNWNFPSTKSKHFKQQINTLISPAQSREKWNF